MINTIGITFSEDIKKLEILEKKYRKIQIITMVSLFITICIYVTYFFYSNEIENLSLSLINLGDSFYTGVKREYPFEQVLFFKLMSWIILIAVTFSPNIIMLYLLEKFKTLIKNQKKLFV